MAIINVELPGKGKRAIFINSWLMNKENLQESVLYTGRSADDIL